MLSPTLDSTPLSADQSDTLDRRTDALSWIASLAEQLRSYLDTDLVVLDAKSGTFLDADEGTLPYDWNAYLEPCRRLFETQRCDYIEELSPLSVLAVPLPDGVDETIAPVAIVAYLSLPVRTPADLAAAAAWMEIDQTSLGQWADGQQPRDANLLLRTAELLVERWTRDAEVKRLRHELDDVSTNLLNVYEEISLLHRLTQNLRISSSDVKLGRIALKWLVSVVPAEGFVIWLPDTEATTAVRPDSETETIVVTEGACPLDAEALSSLCASLGSEVRRGPTIRNHLDTDGSDWPFQQIRQIIAVPLTEGTNIYGFLLALNHLEDKDFGTVESSLLDSVATILATHRGNLRLYRKQSQFFAEMVRALSSAIDAKDPYTCGHSDRVGRLAVRLGKELAYDDETLNTLYLSGLLHDIGKIGIDDRVLRKKGKLTAEEFEHIKLHPKLGYKILRDITQLDQVLPVVLHHHEAWDGSGYPVGLAGEQTPLLARVVAVADAFDAMSSDRPYRPGMPDKKLDQVMRGGAGQQWDPTVVQAFFAARDDLRKIVRNQNESERPELGPTLAPADGPVAS